jgi:hypothetical protein
MPQTSLSENGMSASSFTCDPLIIDCVQEAIIHMKSSQQQCNISRIFKYLKEKMPDNERVMKLTEKCLISQLELAVRDGILSRKFSTSSSNASSSLESSQSPSHKSKNLNAHTVYKLPLLSSHLSSSKLDTEQVNMIEFYYMRLHLCIIITFNDLQRID